MPSEIINNIVNPIHITDDKVNTKIRIIKNNEKKFRWYETETKIIWKNVVLIVGFHIMAVYYYITFPYIQHKFLILWSFYVTHFTTFGITAGAHRLWAHRTYKAKIPLRIILAMCFYSAGQRKIYNWVRGHRIHHKYVDSDADPHNSRRGFWFSHIGWLILENKYEVRKYENEVNMTDILQDQVVQFFDGHCIIMNVIFTFIIPICIPIIFLNQDIKWTIISQIFWRYAWVLHMTWSVNSFAHMFGSRTYDKSIPPTENRIIAFITCGEGWHNYHHVFPWDYKSAEWKCFLFNITTYYIDMFAKIGWAYDLKYASPGYVQKIVEKKGDGTHHYYTSSE